MPKVAVPSGCYGLEFQDGSKPDANRQGIVDVTEEQAKALKNSWAGEVGVMSSQSLSFGTQGTRTCPKCHRKWNSWTKICHKCLVETEES